MPGRQEIYDTRDLIVYECICPYLFDIVTLVHEYEQDKSAIILNNWPLTTQKVQTFGFGAGRAVRNKSLRNKSVRPVVLKGRRFSCKIKQNRTRDCSQSYFAQNL